MTSSDFSSISLIDGFLLVFLLLSLSCPLLAAEFQEADFLELLSKSEVVASFDFQSGRFLKSKAAPVPMSELSLRMSIMDEKIAELEKEKASISPDALLGNLFAKSESWDKVKKLQDEIEFYKKQREEVYALYYTGGMPEEELHKSVVSDIVMDVRKKLVSEIGNPDDIFINTLPVRYWKPPIYDRHRKSAAEFQNFFDAPERQALEAYIGVKARVGAIFGSAGMPVIYKKDKAE